MKAEDLIFSFEFPEEVLVNRRISKKLLMEYGNFNSTDKRQVCEGIEELMWIAALKPTKIGIEPYIDSKNEILEIAVLYLRLRSGGKEKRLIELVHRAIPYPVVLITLKESTLSLSLAEKRRSESEMDKMVIDGEIFETHLDENLSVDISKEFRHALALSRNSNNSLHDLYVGWIDTILALQVAQLKGAFTMPTSKEHAVNRRKALRRFVALNRTINELRAAARKEKQMAKKVELNMKLKKLQNEYMTTCARL